MNKFLKIFSKHKQEANKELDKISEEYKLVEKECEENLKNSTEQMLKKYCPINKANCSKECVHFNEGTFFIYLDYKDAYSSGESSPLCKLWW